MMFPKVKWGVERQDDWYTIIAEIELGTARYCESRCLHKMELSSLQHPSILCCVVERMQNNILEVIGEMG